MTTKHNFKSLIIEGQTHILNKAYINDEAERWIIDLLTTQRKQCTYDFKRDDKVCAIGLYGQDGFRCLETLGLRVYNEPLTGAGAVFLMNDRRGMSFKEIAQELISEPKRFFMEKIRTCQTQN